MSLVVSEIAPILETQTRHWTDLNRDGRRMDKIIKKCMTEFNRKQDHSIKLAYLDRLLKATATKQSLAITVLGVKKSLEDARKR